MAIDTRMSVNPDPRHPLDRGDLGVRDVHASVWSVVRSSNLMRVLLLLLALDIAFAIIEVAVIATDYGFKGAYRLSLQTEKLGIPELVGYGYELGVYVLLFAAARRWRSAAAWFWSGLFFYLFLDDALQLHEHIGGWLADVIGLPAIAGLRSQDLGEAVFYVIVGTVALLGLIAAERRMTGPGVSSLTKLMLPITILYGFFAVVVDLALQFRFETSIEDGGEMVCLTLALVAAAAWVWHSHRYEDDADTGRSLADGAHT